MLFVSKSYDKLYIKGRDSNKSVVFTPARWASFRLCLDEIDNELHKQKRGELVNYRKHYGGGWHVSVTSIFEGVDLRRYFIPLGSTTYKHTITGISLQWLAFKRVVERLDHDNPVIANFTPCIHNQDHSTPEAIATCQECNPTNSTMMYKTNNCTYNIGNGKCLILGKMTT